MKLFIDTGAFYARYIRNDDYHGRALRLWQKVAKEKIKCQTTNFILAEFGNLMIRKVGIPNTVKTLREIYSSHVIEIESLTKQIEVKALDWLVKFPDQDFSFTDTTSFTFMTDSKLKTAFTFDHHFEIAGFNKFA